MAFKECVAGRGRKLAPACSRSRSKFVVTIDTASPRSASRIRARWIGAGPALLIRRVSATTVLTRLLRAACPSIRRSSMPRTTSYSSAANRPTSAAVHRPIRRSKPSSLSLDGCQASQAHHVRSSPGADKRSVRVPKEGQAGRFRNSGPTDKECLPRACASNRRSGIFINPSPRAISRLSTPAFRQTLLRLWLWLWLRPKERRGAVT